MWGTAAHDNQVARALVLEPSELFGFGLGAFQTTAEQPTAPCLPFDVTTDLDNVVVISGEGTKKLIRVCSAIASSLDEGIPDVGIQFHKLTQQTRVREGRSEDLGCTM